MMMNNIDEFSIFVASSAELKSERDELSDLMLDMNEKLEEKGIKMKSVQWEFMDSSMGKKDKEDEYLERLKECEICIVLFWQILGKYTVEELNVAVEEMIAGRLPRRVCVLYKESAEDISEELKKFKMNFYKKYKDIPVFTFTGMNNLREKVETVIVEHFIM